MGGDVTPRCTGSTPEKPLPRELMSQGKDQFSICQTRSYFHIHTETFSPNRVLRPRLTSPEHGVTRPPDSFSDTHLLDLDKNAPIHARASIVLWYGFGLLRRRPLLFLLSSDEQLSGDHQTSCYSHGVHAHHAWNLPPFRVEPPEFPAMDAARGQNRKAAIEKRRVGVSVLIAFPHMAIRAPKRDSKDAPL